MEVPRPDSSLEAGLGEAEKMELTSGTELGILSDLLMLNNTSLISLRWCCRLEWLLRSRLAKFSVAEMVAVAALESLAA